MLSSALDTKKGQLCSKTLASTLLAILSSLPSLPALEGESEPISSILMRFILPLGKSLVAVLLVRSGPSSLSSTQQLSLYRVTILCGNNLLLTWFWQFWQLVGL